MLADRVDLLVALLRGNGAWTATVARESERSATRSGLHGLTEMPSIFGSPLYLETPQEMVDAASTRALMSIPGDGPRAHLGEAEAVAIIGARGLRAAFVTDDRQAHVIARARGVMTYSTCDLLKLAVRVSLLTAEEAWTIVTSLRRSARTLHRSPSERHTYMSWVADRTA